MIIDNKEFEFAKYDPSTADKVKDFTMADGSISRYVYKKAVVSLSCTIFLDKTQLETFRQIMTDNNEHTVEYNYDGVQTAYMFADNIKYKKLVYVGDTEYWEVSFVLKECRRNGI